MPFDRFGIPGFQVLFIAKSRYRLERIEKLCGEALEGRHPSLFLFSTPDESRRDPLATLGMI
jgi:hypothetical protein